MPSSQVRTSPSLDRPSVALRLGSSTLPNSTLLNTGSTDNQYCKPSYSKPNYSQPTRLLVRLSSHTDTHTYRQIYVQVQISVYVLYVFAARFLAIYIGPRSAGPRSTRREPPIGSSLAAGALAISGADLQPRRHPIKWSWFGSFDLSLIL
ncbi:hypothetical protein T08_6191 [Trichinella sp. T8]|nr:hypothetical protein T08_6191 [Trichinella sp. T8]